MRKKLEEEKSLRSINKPLMVYALVTEKMMCAGKAMKSERELAEQLEVNTEGEFPGNCNVSYLSLAMVALEESVGGA